MLQSTLVVLAFIVVPVITHATTYYVRASGNDARDGLTPATAFASIKPAARLLQNPGDRLIVGPGTYNEGNIKPRGSGTAEAPIVLHGDITGTLTGDPAGSVLIRPPNTPDATTGIIVYGRSHIVIENFTIDGADDAGIQIRPHSRTGVDSHDITIRNNNARNGRRKGIQVIAAGDVVVSGNRVILNKGAGLALSGGQDSKQRPQVSDNIAEDNHVGLSIRRSLGGIVTGNTLRSHEKGLRLEECDGLTVTGNDVLEVPRVLVGSASNLTVADNVMEGGGVVNVAGKTRFTKNQFTNRYSDLRLYGVADAEIELVQNRMIAPTFVYGFTTLNVTQNEGGGFFASAVNGTVVENRFERDLDVSASANLELTRNTVNSLAGRGTLVVSRDNEVATFAVVSAVSATVTGNRAERIVVMGRPPWFDPTDPGDNARGPYFVEGNVSNTVVRIGHQQMPLANPVVRANEAGTMLRVDARGDARLERNQTRGIVGIMSGPDSRLFISENTSRLSPVSGLIAIGATEAIIRHNTSWENQESGLAARGIRNLTIAGNTLQRNPQGGISVLTPIAGDCNSSLTVTVNELVMAMRIALDQTALATCQPADASGDEVVTIDEVLLAVRAVHGMLDAREGRIEIRDNRVEDNGRFGINVFTDVTVLSGENRVLRNGGIAFALQGLGTPNGTAITGNILGGSAAEGMLLRGTDSASVRNNVIFSNREAGILLREASRTAVINNLIYTNGDDGISVGLGTEQPVNEVTLANNTIYANAGWGVTMGSTSAPSQGIVVRNNILHDNQRGAIAADRDSRTGLAIDFNLNNDGNEDSLAASDTEFEGDPRFVAPAGADGVLGGAGFEDDDLHLRAGAPASAAIDAGSAPAAELGITGSAIAGQNADVGIVDVGFHYDAE